jgi:hypothetical protein
MDPVVRLLIDTGTGYVLQIRKIEYSYVGGAGNSNAPVYHIVY